MDMTDELLYNCTLKKTSQNDRAVTNSNDVYSMLHTSCVPLGPNMVFSRIKTEVIEQKRFIGR